MEHSAVLLACIELPHGFKTFILSIFKWLLKIGFTVIDPFFLPKINGSAHKISVLIAQRYAQMPLIHTDISSETRRSLRCSLMR